MLLAQQSLRCVHACEMYVVNIAVHLSTNIMPTGTATVASTSKAHAGTWGPHPHLTSGQSGNASKGMPGHPAARGILLEPEASSSQPVVQHAIKTVSITLVTRSADILIGDALKSVSALVDACLVVYSSAVNSPTRTLATAAEAIGDKLITYEIPSGSLEKMLNGSLAFARQLGAEWAVLLDPDQKVLLSARFDVLQAVADTTSSGVTQHNCQHSNLDHTQVG